MWQQYCMHTNRVPSLVLVQIALHSRYVVVAQLCVMLTYHPSCGLSHAKMRLWWRCKCGWLRLSHICCHTPRSTPFLFDDMPHGDEAGSGGGDGGHSRGGKPPFRGRGERYA